MSSRTWRLLHTGPRDAAWNMAVDDALLASVAAGKSGPVFRVYQWRPSAFSWGVFQNPGELLNIAACRAAGVGLVRRPTGGGIIAHDGDVSYAVVCRVEDMGRMSVASSYAFLTRFLLTLYRTLGLNAEMSFGPQSSEGIVRPPRFAGFCAGSRGPSDILVGGRKLGGNAQRRRGGALLQHGSIPLRSTVPFTARYSTVPANALAGTHRCLNDLLPVPVDAGLLIHELVNAFGETYGITLARSALTEEEQQYAAMCVRTTYGSDDWILNRRLPDVFPPRHHDPQTSLA